jgi:3-phenylpropionate/trans-cinnamate dioxygenase ferredoxin reductase subunit
VRPDLLVVGGGPAGLAAARGYRDAGGTGTVLVVSADTDPPYNRPPLSKDYLRGETEEHDLPLAEPGEYEDRGIELRAGCTVTGLDAAGHAAVLDTGERLTYGSCVLATGSSPPRCRCRPRTARTRPTCAASTPAAPCARPRRTRRRPS